MRPLRQRQRCLACASPIPRPCSPSCSDGVRSLAKTRHRALPASKTRIRFLPLQREVDRRSDRVGVNADPSRIAFGDFDLPSGDRPISAPSPTAPPSQAIDYFRLRDRNDSRTPRSLDRRATRSEPFASIAKPTSLDAMQRDCAACRWRSPRNEACYILRTSRATVCRSTWARRSCN